MANTIPYDPPSELPGGIGDIGGKAEHGLALNIGNQLEDLPAQRSDKVGVCIYDDMGT